MTRGVRAPGARTVAPTDLMTIEQAAAYLGTGERFVRRLISQRRIPVVQLGRHVRLERSSLDQFIDAGRVASR